MNQYQNSLMQQQQPKGAVQLPNTFNPHAQQQQLNQQQQQQMAFQRADSSNGIDSANALAQQQASMLLMDQNYHTGFTEFQDINRILWTGSFMIKNDTASIAMNYVSGNIDIARSCLTQMTIDSKNLPLRILQRMRLEQNQLEGVQRKLQVWKKIWKKIIFLF